MGFLAHVHRQRAEDMRSRHGPDSDFWYAPPGWYQAFQDTGIHVTPEIAMSVSAFWAGITFVARNLGSMPAIVYERYEVRDGKEGKRRAKKEPLYRTLHRRPNRQQTPMEYFEMAIGHVMLRGNFYARMVEGSRSFAEQLIPLHPDLVIPERLPSGLIRYTVYGRPGTEPEKLFADTVHHVRGFMSDGVTGISLPAVASRSIGAAVAAETFAARLLSRGVTASLAVMAPPGDEESDNKLRRAIQSYLTGLDNAGGVLIVPAGATIDKLGISPHDMQLLPAREHVVREAARWLGLPTQVLADAGKEPTHASSQVFALQLVTQCFRPMAIRFEQPMERDLILERDEERLFIEFLLDALLRGDLKARAQFYQLAILAGWMTRNEAREKENMDPGPEELDEFWQPTNIGVAGDTDEDEDDDGATPNRRNRATAPRRNSAQVAARFGVRATLMALEVAGRLVRKEVTLVEKAAKKYAQDGAGWSAWIQQFYGSDEYAREVASTLKIPLNVAREYAARQGLALAQSTVGVSIVESWPDTIAPDLAALALGDHDVVALHPERR